MSLKTVILRTAHYIENVWHPAGTQLQIPPEHFDPNLHKEVKEDAASIEPKAESATSIHSDSSATLLGSLHTRLDAVETAAHAKFEQLEASVHERLERLEQTVISALDFKKLEQRVEALEAVKPAVTTVLNPAGIPASTSPIEGASVIHAGNQTS